MLLLFECVKWRQPFTLPRLGQLLRGFGPFGEKLYQILVLSLNFLASGIGICADDRQFIFDEFFQVEDATSMRYRGAGLGLTLARAVAEQHGGVLRLGNRPDGGLVASVSLPLV